ncbi:hypothetical protein MUA01_02915 [Enterobacteriaceae bacterium H18W14]|uniref:hypothetical protein n=1 Tax=Dryocola boscaweniae TaxID=2925397 RepID=UPI0022F0977B|nr:hypothetical protein [Dryocola boscaweniae]MCT4713944.1 hypothetical protein [Dryocola boscaweniae]
MTADIGRDLTLSSGQDSERYDNKQSSVSGGASVAVIGSGASGSGSVSLSRNKMHGT